MSTEVQTELERIESNVAAAYAAAEEQGADMPEAQTTDNLAETVSSIKSVKFTEQALSDDQQAQARTNIGAASQADLNKLSSEKVDLTGYAKEYWVNDNYQPKGNYALRSDLPKAVYVTFTDNGDGTGTADKTWAEIQAAYENGSTIIGSINTAGVAGVIIGVCNINSDHVMLANISADAKLWAAMLDSTDTVLVASVDVIPEAYTHPATHPASMITGLAAVATTGKYSDLADRPTIPTVPSALKNPNALTFTGAVTGSYDGSAAKTVNIPTVPTALKNPKALTVNGTTYDGSAAVDMTGVISALIDTKLGVIENGTY